MRHRKIALAFSTLGVVAALIVGAMVVLARADLRPVIERIAGDALGRTVKIAALRIAWGDPIIVEAEGLRLANAAWGSDPQMIRIQHISAQIDPWPLLRGVVRYRKLNLINPTLVLERNGNGMGNWRFAQAGPKGAPAAGGLAVVPKNRSQFPSLLDFRMSGGLVTYRTSNGHTLRLDLRKLTVAAAGDDQPTRLEVNGGYDGTPVHLVVKGQSFARMRNASVPFGVAFSLTASSSTIGFSGNVMKPLDFDGVDGRLDMRARKLGDFLKSFHVDTRMDFSAALSGALHRDGSTWEVRNTRGSVADDKFAGQLVFEEGGRGQADDVRLDFDFDRLDLNPLLDSDRKGSAATGNDHDAWSLSLDAKPGMTIDAKVTASRVRYGKVRGAQFVVRGRSLPARIVLSELSLGWLGGRVAASGSMDAEADSSRMTAQLSLSGVDIVQLARLIDAVPDQLWGRVTALASLDTAGKTLQRALKESHGKIVLTMEDGRVAQSLVEKASTDLRALFREGEGWERLTCALGIIEVQNGVGTLSPLRLRTPQTTFVAAGTIDLSRRAVDVILRTEAGGSSAFALRLPIRISGGFGALSARPLMGGAPASSARSAGGNAVDGLPTRMRQLATQSPCLH